MTSNTAKKDFTTNSPSAGVGQNLLWMIWSGTISIANSVLIWIFIARMRDEEELGRFTIVLGLYALFYGVCSLGLMPFLVSETSRRNKRSEGGYSQTPNSRTVAGFISSASVFLLISGTICALLMAVTGFLVSRDWTIIFPTLILSLAMIPTGLICLAEASAISFGRTRLIAFATTLENVLRTIVPLGLLWFGFPIWTICLSFAAVRIVALAVYLCAARKTLRFFCFDKADFFNLIRVSPTFAGIIILSSLNMQAAVILLARMSTVTESAKYGVASRFLIPVTILMASYAGVIQPILTQLTQKSIAEAGRYLFKMASYPLILASLAAVLSPFLSKNILAAFFGDTYKSVAPTLDVLALSLIPFCLVIVVARGLVATGSQRIDLIANALGVVFCFSTGSILIPRYGAIGAAIAQLCSFLAMALIGTVYLSRKYLMSEFCKKSESIQRFSG